jgi:SAM-dependent methyltransferase
VTENADDYARRYAAQYDRAAFETVIVAARRRRVLASVEAHSHRAMLEVGCGLEPLFPHVSGYDAYTVVEPAPEFAARARANAAGDERIRIVGATLETAAPTLSMPFDFVVVSSLLHEVPDPRALLHAVRTVAPPGAVVHVNVPNVRSFHRLLGYEMGVIGDVFEASETERHFGRHSRFDRDTLLSLLDEEGFEALDWGTYFVKLFTHDQMDRLIASGIVPGSIVEGLERMTKYMPELGSEMYADVRVR